MNINQAKQIPVQNIAEALGGRLSHKKTGEIWYHSPFRPDEKTASFKVNEEKNTWYDFAEGKGGSGLDLWLDYYQQDRKDGKAIKLALDGLKPLAATIPLFQPIRRTTAQPGKPGTGSKSPTEPARFKLMKEPGKIWLDSLKEEIGRRGLSLQEVATYLKQAFFKDTEKEKTYNGIAFQNDKEGYEISIPNPSKGQSFKTNIGPKSPTSFITGKYSKAVVFEGFWDFLTWLHVQKSREGFEIFVLNSLSFVGEVAQQIISHKGTIDSVFLFLDNDDAGEKGTHRMAYLLEPEGFTIGTMSHLYQGYKDLNDYWIKDTNARRQLVDLNRPQIVPSNNPAQNQADRPKI